ncbi:disease resistance protein RPV1-like [Populus alba x Populus x berolinensis]|uniref:Disease resistance protein RPV1-like n=1 Tax=Populus alba x Populus x berolinensis TaxID=444605 RepID=A0AAD6Q4J7_9ROSI|nr:disease resistance protein RPV1-like [Populus alba x Populus x berolinensis]
MAAGKYQESYSSRFSNCKYQVFLSFRGEDTRKNFTDHLYKALVDAGFHTFRDDDEIRRGKNIQLELQKAIQQSKIAIIVFSKNYASSRWCLDELVMIMERKRNGDCIVFPVFYHVDPSEVRNQTGSFAAAFVEHEKHYKEEMERVNGWRIALKEIANLAGMDLGDGYEAQFVQSIVENVSKNLDPKIFNVPLHFIGRDPLVQDINSWLQDGSHGAAIALLYGIGGVGKTTIAKSVFNQNFYKFEGKSFLSNFRSKDIVCLQRQLIFDILNKTVEINDEDEGILKIKDALCCRRTLIVLDDVDKRDQFNKIIGMQNWLCKGSKIIVTTRNKGLFSANDIEGVRCKVGPLDDEKSLELFSWNAFGQADPADGFVEDSWRILRHCNGLPLAHRVIGSSLSGKGREIWESALQKMEVIPNCEVQKVLQISYDSLDDDYQKALFLDIACFFNGMDVDDVVTILDGLDKGARFGIDNLLDRCLVEINNDKRLWMHQLVRDMGREIARQESPKCQRIWRHEDAFTVLKGTTDAKKLRGLTLDMHALMEDDYTKVVCTNLMVRSKRRKLNFFQQWLSDFFDGEKLQTGQTSLFPILNTDAFRKMPDIKFLQLNYTKFYGSFEHFPKNLIWLCWHGFSSRSIPNQQSLWFQLITTKFMYFRSFFPKLKILDLRHSHDLIRTPDFSGLPALVKLILEDCIRLVQIHESIGDLQRLLILNLRNCTSLIELPEEMSRLNSLQELVLDGCSNLDSLNMELEHHQGRSLLQSYGIVASTSHITSLPLKLFFPSRFSARKILRFTSFSLPHSLTRLDLSGTPIHFLPESIKDLGQLRHLYLRNCKMLRALQELPSHLWSLDVSYCYSLQRPTNPNSSNKADGCDQFVEFQDWIKQELIQSFDSHVFRIMETRDDLPCDCFPDEMLRRFHEEEEEDKWLIQNEFTDNFSFKISSHLAHRICGFNLFTRFSVTSEYDCTEEVGIGIRNNTIGQSLHRQGVFPACNMRGFREIQSLSHWKLGANDPTFDNGDDVSISVLPHDSSLSNWIFTTYDNGDDHMSISVLRHEPAIQIRTIGIQWLHEEEGNDNDIQSKNEDITSHCSSSSNSKVINANNSSDEDDVLKVGIASHILTNYYCLSHFNHDAMEARMWTFEKKVREAIEQ